MGKLEGEFFIEDEPGLVEKLELLGAGISEGGKQKLPLLEAAYFEEKGAICTGKKAEELIELAKEKDVLAKERFAVLKELRDSGYIVRIGKGDLEFLRVYKKGIRVGEDRTESIVKVLKEGEKPDLLSDLVKAARMRKNLYYAFISDEWKIVFVKAYRANFE